MIDDLAALRQRLVTARRQMVELMAADRDVHGRPVWVHATGGCWREYVRKRRAEAVEALATAGIVSPGASWP